MSEIKQAVGSAGGADTVSPPLLEARGIVKIFGETIANKNVDFDIVHGEIHALLGENGAGKSTLVKILYGSLQPNEGTVSWRGNPVVIPSPAAARRLGIGMVFQHFSLFEALTVAENIALALPKSTSFAQLSGTIAEVSNDYGLPLTPTTRVVDMSVGERQRIEIVRCLLQDPALIIMDEPTSVLTPQEADQLFVTLERLASEDRAILYISHRLEEVKKMCRRATILRHGEVVDTCNPGDETAASLARMMVGADIHVVRAEVGNDAGQSRLKASGLSLAADGPFGVPLRDISLDVRAGEVVAIAGVAGNGQGELFDALSGERRAQSSDAVQIDGKPCANRGVTSRRRLGAAFIPEERLGHGAVPGMTLSENITLTRFATGDGILRRGFIQGAVALDIEERISRDFDVRKGRRDPEARSLSGGNLQKFVMGREIDRNPGILVASQPTWGVDAGAAATIRQALVDLARSGAAVLVISQDLDEIFEVADRIAVISRGYLSEAHPAAEMTPERIGLLMGGAGEGDSTMRIELQKRPEHSQLMTILSPIIAIGLTIFFGGLLFAALGLNPAQALYLYFITPLTEAWTLQELVVKATPLVLIGVGLAVCYLSNIWNIGAEGQLTAGALAGSIIPIVFWQWEGPFVLPAMLAMGILGGMAFGAIPALLKIRFGANEILTSLMLVYVAQLFLDWLVRGYWRDPDGYNFPESRLFNDSATLPMLGDGRMHLGAVFAIIAVIALAIMLLRTLKGFEIRVLGEAPRAGRFAGFSQNKMVLFAFLLSGGLAGLAGIAEVAGPIGQLRPNISPGYGFTAIIVAFLGRLNPIGILLAGLLLALSYLGGEAAQVTLGISDKITRVFQGMLLFFVLACDTFILYRVRFITGAVRVGGG